MLHCSWFKITLERVELYHLTIPVEGGKGMKFFIVAVLLFTVFALPAWGDAGGIPHNPHDAVHTCAIGVTNEDGKSGTFDTSTNGSWAETIGEDGQLHFTYDFYSETGYDILSTDGTGTVLGTIYSLNYDGKPDPQVIVNFSCKAGATDSTFSFITSIGVIPTITDPIAKASASLTLTDNSVPSNGAYANGYFGGDCYQARYNNGTVFTSLVSGFGIDSGSQTASENDPFDGSSYRTVFGTVTQMEAEYKFTLKKYDSASGTSNFVMLPTVPEPSSMLGLGSALIGLIGFGLRKRR